MEIITHNINNIQIAELVSEEILIKDAQTGLDLLGDLYYSYFEKVIIYKKNITDDFFDLKNGLAGEVLQKFANYRMQLYVIGDFSMHNTKSIKDFIYECNKGNQTKFLLTLEEALEEISGK